MTKRWILITLLFVLVLSLCGCSLNEKPVSLDSSMEIPEDGIVPASVFEHIQKENKVITLFGHSGDAYYEWTVFGRDVEIAQDTNMKLEVISDGDGRMDFRLCSENSFAFSPVLSLHSSFLWDADNAIVYCDDKDNSNQISSASVTGTKKSVLNFALSQPGQYSIIAEKNDESNELVASLSKEEKNENSTKLQTSQVNNDPYLTDANIIEGHVISDGKQTDPSIKDSTSTRQVVRIQGQDSYLTQSENNGGRIISDGKNIGKDQYLTDPVPKGKPMPVEPETQKVDGSKSYTCTFSIECSTILNNLDDLNEDKLDAVPSNGIIYPKQTVTFYEDESVFDVLQRICKENGIHMEASWTPIYNSAYVEGIHNLYEFDCGTGSGWMYRVNGWYPNYGCSRYQLAQGDNVEWRYTCDLGSDIGGGYAIGE